MKTNQYLLKAILLAVIIFITIAHSVAQKSTKIDDKIKIQTIDSITYYLENWYIFSDKGELVANGLRDNLKNGKYDNVNDAAVFADLLGNDMRAIHKDEHFGVKYNPDAIKRTLAEQKCEPNKNDALLSDVNKYNHNGFSELKILEGNIGYIKLDKFISTTKSGESAVAAMSFVKNCNAVIFDLRDNSGGDGSLVQLLISYFLKEQDTQLNTLEVRKDNISRQYWTLPYIPGQRMPDKDLYILTGKYTFSAAEAFTYDLQAMKRATIIGERTYGGAHATEKQIINDLYIFSIPVARSVNPITNTNWEGTGVIPDIETIQENALDTCVLIALKKFQDEEENKTLAASLDWEIERINAKLDRSANKIENLNIYVGKYGPRNIIMEDNKLFYMRDGGTKREMTEIKKGYFLLKGYDDFRIKFEFKDDEVIALNGIYKIGFTDRNEKNLN